MPNLHSPIRPSDIVINRRHPRAMQIAALLMSIINRHVRVLDRDAERDLARELEDQLWCDGAHMITEGDRVAAGLPPRNIYGLTVEELKAIEMRMLANLMSPRQILGDPLATEKGD